MTEDFDSAELDSLVDFADPVLEVGGDEDFEYDGTTCAEWVFKTEEGGVETCKTWL